MGLKHALSPKIRHLHYVDGSSVRIRYRMSIIFEHETPSLILWEIIEELLEDVRPNYQYTQGDS